MEISKKRKILIIENQYTQFSKIFGNLGVDEFKKYPNIEHDKYVHFIDHVRVWVNEKYIEDQRKRAIKYINKLINKEGIELILMDHILGGAHHCKTGIDLAYTINKTRKESNTIIPVLFLSKTKHDDKKREKGGNIFGTKIKGINEYGVEFNESNYKWVHKGYFGDEILDPKYFELNVIPKIQELLGASEEERFWKAVNNIISIYFPENQEFKRAYLINLAKNKNYKAIETIRKTNIIEVSESTNINDLNIIENEQIL